MKDLGGAKARKAVCFSLSFKDDCIYTSHASRSSIPKDFFEASEGAKIKIFIESIEPNSEFIFDIVKNLEGRLQLNNFMIKEFFGEIYQL